MSQYLSYEYIEGTRVHRRLAGRLVPVPQEQVRAWAGVPTICEMACLSHEIKEFYPSAVRSVLVRYVKDYPQVAYYGSTLVIAGGFNNMNARRWAASAVLNEIVMRFNEVADVTTRWVSQHTVAALLDMRANKSDGYLPMKARLFDTKLLMVLEPQQCVRGTEEGHFMETLFEHRGNARLPTVVTVSMDEPEGDVWEALYKPLGPYTSEMLRSTCHDYFVRY